MLMSKIFVLILLKIKKYIENIYFWFKDFFKFKKKLCFLFVRFIIFLREIVEVYFYLVVSLVDFMILINVFFFECRLWLVYFGSLCLGVFLVLGFLVILQLMLVRMVLSINFDIMFVISISVEFFISDVMIF